MATKAVKTGQKFILLRRWKDEIKTDKIEQYFNDVDVEKLTDGVYNCITLLLLTNTPKHLTFFHICVKIRSNRGIRRYTIYEREIGHN